jgi:hypothetical protein
VCANAPTSEPAAYSSSPIAMIGLRPSVRPPPERDLEQRLGQSIGAHREPEQLRRVVGQLAAVERQHGQQQEQAEHARRINTCERTD